MSKRVLNDCWITGDPYPSCWPCDPAAPRSAGCRWNPSNWTRSPCLRVCPRCSPWWLDLLFVCLFFDQDLLNFAASSIPPKEPQGKKGSWCDVARRRSRRGGGERSGRWREERRERENKNEKRKVRSRGKKSSDVHTGPVVAADAVRPDGWTWRSDAFATRGNAPLRAKIGEKKRQTQSLGTLIWPWELYVTMRMLSDIFMSIYRIKNICDFYWGGGGATIAVGVKQRLAKLGSTHASRSSISVENWNWTLVREIYRAHLQNTHLAGGGGGSPGLVLQSKHDWRHEMVSLGTFIGAWGRHPP